MLWSPSWADFRHRSTFQSRCWHFIPSCLSSRIFRTSTSVSPWRRLLSNTYELADPKMIWGVKQGPSPVRSLTQHNYQSGTTMDLALAKLPAKIVKSFYTLRQSLRIPLEEETILWSCAMPTLQRANQSRQTRDSMLSRFLVILKLLPRSLGMALIKNILFVRRTTTGRLDGSTKTKLLENACLQAQCTCCTFF